MKTKKNLVNIRVSIDIDINERELKRMKTRRVCALPLWVPKKNCPKLRSSQVPQNSLCLGDFLEGVRLVSKRGLTDSDRPLYCFFSDDRFT